LAISEIGCALPEFSTLVYTASLPSKFVMAIIASITIYGFPKGNTFSDDEKIARKTESSKRLESMRLGA